MTTPHRIQLRRTKGWKLPEGAKACTRPGRFSNPFRIGSLVREPGFWGHCSVPYNGVHPVGTTGVGYTIDNRPFRWVIRTVVDAADAVALFRAYVAENDDLWDQRLAELSGHDLACSCSLDQPCHADVLLELANPTQDEFDRRLAAGRAARIIGSLSREYLSPECETVFLSP